MRDRWKPHHVAFPRRSSRVLSGHRFRLDEVSAVTRLIRALADPAMTVRRASVIALLRLEAMNAVLRIARVLEEDESGGVRVIAAGVLGKFEDPRAVPALVRALGDVQWYVRQASATALGQIGDRRAMVPLEKATRDPRKSVARAAAAALRALRA